MSQRGVNTAPSFPRGSGMGRVIGVVIVLFILAVVGLMTVVFVQIDEGERGVVVVQGAVTEIAEPGPFFRLFQPFTKVVVVNVKRQTRQITQNVASSDKQLYDVIIAVDYSRNPAPEALKAQYAEIGVSDDQLTVFLDGFINDALKSASTQFTLDQVLADRVGLSSSISKFLTTPPGEGRKSPIDQLYVRLEAVKVVDVQVGEQYAKLLAEKANLEVQIETEEKRRQQIQAEQSNNLFRAQQEAEVKLTTEKGITAAALEAAERDARVRAIQGRYWRENPELFELRKRELLVEMLQNGNMWFLDPNTNITLLLDRMSSSSPIVVPPATSTPSEETTP